MIHRLRVLSLLPLFSILLGIFSSGNCLGPQYAEPFERELLWIIIINPRYVWGGSESEEKGLDCSGYVFLAAKRAGIPISRTTALHMANGLGGWHGQDVESLSVAKPLDIVWWTWTDKLPSRPHGHVGVLLRRPRAQTLEVTHASSGRGVILDPIQGKLKSDISKIRRLTIGD